LLDPVDQIRGGPFEDHIEATLIEISLVKRDNVWMRAEIAKRGILSIETLFPTQVVLGTLHTLNRTEPVLLRVICLLNDRHTALADIGRKRVAAADKMLRGFRGFVTGQARVQSQADCSPPSLGGTLIPIYIQW
jgi:hypothetical protein